MRRKKIFNIANYRDNSERKFGMLCKTEEEAKTFCNYLDSLGKSWSFYYIPYAKETHWDDEPIVYYFNRDTYRPLRQLSNESNDIILAFNDFDWSLHQHPSPTHTFIKADLKDGQIVKVRSGEKYIKIKDHFINLVEGIFIDYYYTESLESTVDKSKDIVAVYELIADSVVHLPASLYTLLMYSSEYLTCIWSREEDEKAY